MTHSELPPLPNQTDYLRAVQETDQSFRINEGADQMITRHLSQIAQGGRRYDSFFDIMGKLAQIVEPMDRSLGTLVNDDGGAPQALMQGSAAGLLVIDRLHDGLIRPAHVFEAFPLALPAETDDMYDAHHSFSSQVRIAGEKGLVKIGDEAAAVVESWENEVVVDVRRQYLFRVGLGIVALGAFGYHERLLEEQNEYDLKAFERELSSVHDFDWDAASAKLFDNEG